MNFELDSELLALRGAVRRLASDLGPSAEPQAVHTALASTGLLGMPFGMQYGGSGAGPLHTMVVAQELGRAGLGQQGFIAHTVLAGTLLAHAGSDAQRQHWLPRVCEGQARLALAAFEAGRGAHLSGLQTAAQRRGKVWRVSGHKAAVAGGDAADAFLVLARTAGPMRSDDDATLFLVPAGQLGLQRHPGVLLDGQGMADLTLQDLTLADSALVGPPHDILPWVEQALDRANAALCAEAAGAMETLLELSAEHLRTRRQFGAPLARFQALQHGVADAAMAVEQVKSLAHAAALGLAQPDAATRQRLASAAKAHTAQLARRLALNALQWHGALGLTAECRASRIAKQLIALGLALGDAPFHLQRFQQAQGDRA